MFFSVPSSCWKSQALQIYWLIKACVQASHCFIVGIGFAACVTEALCLCNTRSAIACTLPLKPRGTCQLRLLTPPVCSPCCVHQCRGSSGRHLSMLISQYRFESFLHEAVLQALPSLHAYARRDSTSALFCRLLCPFCSYHPCPWLTYPILTSLLKNLFLLCHF